MFLIYCFCFVLLLIGECRYQIIFFLFNKRTVWLVAHYPNFVSLLLCVGHWRTRLAFITPDTNNDLFVKRCCAKSPTVQAMLWPVPEPCRLHWGGWEVGTTISCRNNQQHTSLWQSAEILLHWMHFNQYQPSSAALEWLRDVDWYLMHVWLWIRDSRSVYGNWHCLCQLLKEV